MVDMDRVDAYLTASKVYDNMVGECACFEQGRRNNDAVNWCIICYVLGKDPIEEFMRKQPLSIWGTGSKSSIDQDFIKRADVINAYIENEWNNGGSPQLDTQVLTYAFDDADEWEWVER